MAEEWRPVVGYEGFYSVSSLGQLRSETREFVRKNGAPFTLRGRTLRQTHDKRGYSKVELWRDGVQKTVKVHIAVAAAFIGPRPRGMDVCHNDGTPSNCRSGNLRYDTKKGNMADMVAHGTAPRGERCGTAKLSEREVVEIRASLTPSDVMGPAYGISGGQIRRIRRGERWAHLSGGSV